MSHMKRAAGLAATIALTLPAQTAVEQESVAAAPGWTGQVIHSGPDGVWYARVAEFVDAYGPPEVLVTDDAGRVLVLTPYSGKWTARSVIPDRQWLALNTPAAVDPAAPGSQLYVAGRAGNVHQVVVQEDAFGDWSLRSRELGHAAGEEFHAVVAGDLDPERPGGEVLAFGITGAVYLLHPGAGEEATRPFEMRRVGTALGRVRDTVLRDTTGGPCVLGVSRAGHLLEFRLRAGALEQRTLLREPMGLGRIARGPAQGPGSGALWVTRDDGVLLRLELADDGGLTRERVFVGDQGLRGVAVGRFHTPAREAVAVYGYGSKVQVVSRADPDSPWEVETLYDNPDRGHWLAVGELDGRNATDEIIATGFGGRVVLLARPVGYGVEAAAAVDGGAADRAPLASGFSQAENEEVDRRARPWRIAAKASRAAVENLSPLNYQGGFETKTLVYETLVRRGPTGRIEPGLAESWQVLEGGRAFEFVLRDGAEFHDGTPVTAEDVAVHFRRWVGLPEHGWLSSNQRIVRVVAKSARVLRVELDQPHALLPDLCAINPTAIRGPGALDREGVHVRPVGTGPFAFVAARDGGRVLRYRRHGGAGEIDLVRLETGAVDDPLDALAAGEVDAVLGGWLVRLDPSRVTALRTDDRYRVVDGPGSAVVYLSFRTEGAAGPVDRATRRFVAARVDRGALIRAVEHGLADATAGWAAPSVETWPRGTPPATGDPAPARGAPLRIASGRYVRGAAVARVVAQQLRASGLEAVVVSDSADADVRVEVTHGVPYDPYLTLVSRFGPPPRTASAAAPPKFAAADPTLSQLVERATHCIDEAARAKVYAEIQAHFDAEATVVSLYAPRRVAVVRAGMPLPALSHGMYAIDRAWLDALR